MAKAKILIVEDEKDLARLLSYNLKKEGFIPLLANSGEAGLKTALARKPDLVISDIRLPKMDGLEMVRSLRLKSQVPVIFLTSKRAEVDRILGFELGADDYLPKPFSMRELICRVNAVLRRMDRPKAARSASARVGGIEVQYERRVVRVNGKERHLATLEFELLALLIEAQGKVVSREQLLKQLWGIDKSMEVRTRTVDQHVARLRRGLLSEKGRIVTVPNFGYRIKTD
jgi:two-component system phosphate regulon response regulator PhoB